MDPATDAVGEFDEHPVFVLIFQLADHSFVDSENAGIFFTGTAIANGSAGGDDGITGIMEVIVFEN